MSDICTAYLAGKSLLTIAEVLNERWIEYMPGVLGWNKARLKRILEDERYALMIYRNKLRMICKASP